jgi:hypothetical protein
VVACDGFNSKVRDFTDIQLEGERDLQTFINVCFKSKKLARILEQRKLKAMLHFVYNSETVGCMVNHCYREGIFVLQIPISPEVEDVEALLSYRNFNMVLDFFDESIKAHIRNDIKIIHKGIWNLSSMVADRYHQGNIVLAGDSAHSIPPSGGLGMNTGIQDAHNLAHKLIKNYHGFGEGSESEAESLDWLIREYSVERKTAGLFNKRTADTLYQDSIDIAKDLNLSMDNLNLFKKALKAVNADSPSIFNLGKKLGSSFLESDTLFKKLANDTVEKRNGRWIAMIIVENEAEFKYPEPKNALQAESSIFVNQFCYPQLKWQSGFDEGDTVPENVTEKEFRVIRLQQYSGLLSKIIQLKLTNPNTESVSSSTKQTPLEVPEYVKELPKEVRSMS